MFYVYICSSLLFPLPSRAASKKIRRFGDQTTLLRLLLLLIIIETVAQLARVSAISAKSSPPFILPRNWCIVCSPEIHSGGRSRSSLRRRVSLSRAEINDSVRGVHGCRVPVVRARGSRTYVVLQLVCASMLSHDFFSYFNRVSRWVISVKYNCDTYIEYFLKFKIVVFKVET